MSESSVAEKIEQFVMLRDHKESATKELATSLERCNEAMNKLEGELLQELAELGSESIKSKFGTAYKRVVLTATVSDPEEFMEDVKEHGLWDMLDVKANKTEVAAYLKNDLPLPRGVKASQTIKIGIRRATK